MEFLREALSASLQTGFIDQLVHSNKEYRPEMILNDKSAGKKVLTTIDRELKSCEEFWFSVAFVTTSGIATLMNTLLELEEKGIQGKILVSQYLNFSQPEALKRLLKFKNIKLKIAVNTKFHSKGYLFKKGIVNDLIIGSSNLTASALCVNTEWNLKISATSESFIFSAVIKEFSSEFDKAINVDDDFIQSYESIYIQQINATKIINEQLTKLNDIYPNTMQIEALNNLKSLRIEGKRKALLISATGTGKTYLSAFDAKDFNPKRLLFVVHRLNIAKAAMKTFKAVFRESKSMGIYSGNMKELDKDFIFSTIQTISKAEHLANLDAKQFEYVVIDETHRAGAESYQKILNHFKPEFLLGMTATPERTDGLDIFKLFDHTIAYEIRLHRAMEEEMLSPFHYYGVTDISVDGKLLEEKADFIKLTSKERVERIIEKANLYGCDNGIVRGLIFCSKIDECKSLSASFNKKGIKSIALTGESSEDERISAINRLESDIESEKLDYIFTVDIFNEGIDIPKVNQVIMLRPTQSAIIFVQQLGRGLRKIDNKDYLTVIDFIGNYSNNYLVPIALYGDSTYNKDTLRKLIASGSNLIPGSSTINFDKITQGKIFEAIDKANMKRSVDLTNDYDLLKFKLGRIPMMMDFIEHGSRDPFLYVLNSKSYFNFVLSKESTLLDKVSSHEVKLLELLSVEINNSKRIEESLILQQCIFNNQIEVAKVQEIILATYKYYVNSETIESAIRNLNFEFITETKNKKLVSVNEKYALKIIQKNNNQLTLHPSFKELLSNQIFSNFLKDSIDYSLKTYNNLFKLHNYFGGFILYRKYSRKDVFRILNWAKNPVAQNVGGYIISPDKSNCLIFVNYHKAEGISSSTKYEDGFINNYEFEWMSKSKRTLRSNDVKQIIDAKDKMRLPLFIKKSNDEGIEFYYMGDVEPIEGGFEETKMSNDSGKEVPVVKIKFLMKQPVEESIYNYITNE
ncbi:MAG: DEAD/DEAH box helicase [Bacteroidetes bacterium]|nr:DEAD/DEAH box helicase [Bacteroidota bacterium]